MAVPGHGRFAEAGEGDKTSDSPPPAVFSHAAPNAPDTSPSLPGAGPLRSCCLTGFSAILVGWLAIPPTTPARLSNHRPTKPPRCRPGCPAPCRSCRTLPDAHRPSPDAVPRPGRQSHLAAGRQARDPGRAVPGIRPRSSARRRDTVASGCHRGGTLLSPRQVARVRHGRRGRIGRVRREGCPWGYRTGDGGWWSRCGWLTTAHQAGRILAA